MKKFQRLFVLLVVTLLAAVLIGPFLTPIPPLEGVVPPQELADVDSFFTEINGLDVHYKREGVGEPAILLLHGFASSVYSWREVMGSLGKIGQTIAFDRPAFGLTERPTRWEGKNPYSEESAVDLTIQLMDQMEIEQAILIGNSAGGTLSIALALEYPERVQALILVAPAVYAHRSSPAWLSWILNSPQMDRLGPFVVRRIQDWGIDFGERAWHDPSRITPEIWEGYTRPLKAENWDRGLWEFSRASQSSNLEERLGEIQAPILVITGDDDRIVPTEDGIRLAGELPGAELVVIPNCGHAVQEECPQEFLEAVVNFINRVAD